MLATLAARLVLAAPLGAQASPAPATAPPAAPSAESFPTGAIQRHSPIVHRVRFDCVVTTVQLDRFTQETVTVDPCTGESVVVPARRTFTSSPFQLQDAIVVLPLATESGLVTIDPMSLGARLWADDGTRSGRSRADGGLQLLVARTDPPVLVPGLPLDMSNLTLVVGFRRLVALQWEFSWRAQTWSSRVDETMAAQAAWPREWPASVRQALEPQRFVESDDPRFAAFVDRVSGGSLRSVPPYLAAKDLIRSTVNAIRNTGGAAVRGDRGVLRGMNLRGAAAAMSDGRGTDHDIVAACVAVLRAAGIPARPVVGFDPRRLTEHDDVEFLSWGEFFLPGSGWVPFVPARLGSPVRAWDVRAAWPGVGTIDDLNRLVPLGHAFAPTAQGFGWFNAPAVWGINPNASGLGAPIASFSQRILMRASQEQ